MEGESPILNKILALAIFCRDVIIFYMKILIHCLEHFQKHYKIALQRKTRCRQKLPDDLESR